MNLSSSNEEDCPFCQIIHGVLSAREVWRSDEVIAFLPDVPAVVGHTLVLPTRHIRDIWDVDVSLGRILADATGRIAAGVSAATGTRELNIIQSNGVAAGQSVFHLHVHIVPRKPGDRMPALWPVDATWSSNDLERIAESLRAEIS